VNQENVGLNASMFRHILYVAGPRVSVGDISRANGDQ